MIARALGFLVWLLVYAYARLARRPHTVIRIGGRPYITRWFLTATPAAGSTLTEGWHLHRIHVGDGDRRLHNHPTEWARAWVLRGGYKEQWNFGDGAAYCSYLYEPGAKIEIPPEVYHRIAWVRPNTWTLFHAGPKHGRGWGFR